jgi:hypothetical protein
MPTQNQPAAFELSAAQRVYLACCALFVTCLLLSNIVGSKFFHFGTVHLGNFELHIEHSVGMLVFPVTFILTDIINEFFGPKAARRITLLGLATSVFAFVVLGIARAVPAAPAGRTFVDEGMFDTVLGSSVMMIVASLTAYTIGQFTDIVSFQFINRITGGKAVWLRATGSTIISQLIDSIAIMMVIYFWQRATFAQTPGATPPSLAFAIEAGIKGYIIKFCIALLTTPILYAVRFTLQEWFGLQPLKASQKP